MSSRETIENKTNARSALEFKEPVRHSKPPTVQEILESGSGTRKLEILDASAKRKSSSQSTLEILKSQKYSSSPETQSSELVNLRLYGILPWMAKPRKEDTRLVIKEGLEYLQSLNKLYIYEHIQIIDKLFDKRNASENCFTVRNADLQKLYYVGSMNNRSLGKYRAFSLRVIDQYSTHVLTIRKHFNHCFSLQNIDIYCPPNTLIGKVKQRRLNWGLIEYKIFAPNITAPKFIIKRERVETTDNKVKYDFNISTPFESIGSIAKRYEPISDKNEVFLYDDRYVRVTIPNHMSCDDKALLLSAAILMNVFYLRKI